MSNFTVTNTNDSGAGSLRQAILDANSSPGSTINFSITGIITITGLEMLITESTTINGPGPLALNIQRTIGTGKIFNISAVGITINISGLTISNGQTSSSNGGAIEITGIGSILDIDNCIFENNVSFVFGGALSSGSSTVLSVKNTLFRNNTSLDGDGGAIYSNGANACTIIGCSFDSNTVSNSGGAVLFRNISSIIFSDCLFENNTSNGDGGGGGLALESSVANVSSCTFRNNISNTGNGGGLHTNVLNITVTINNCTFDNNRATAVGGGCTCTGTTQIFNSTFSNNIAGTYGGGVYTTSAYPKTIINCTISGNSAGNDGGGICLEHGSIVNIIGSTISNNTTTIGGGGVNISSTSTLSIGNTVVAVNPIGTASDFSFGPGLNTLNSLGYNFIGNATGTGTTFTQSGDQAGTNLSPIDPFLLPLGDYGGPTETMLPVSFISPLIDAGSNTLVTTYYTFPELLNSGSPIDQRGFFRIVNGEVDIGSVESGNIICFSGDSLVLTKNILTGKKETIQAKNVITGIHKVFDTNGKKFIPVKYNIVNGPVTRLWKIAKNSLGKNKPYKDFFVTGGHKLIVNGIIMKARNVPHAQRVRVESQKVYSICTEKQVPILINGLNVMTWSENKFIEYSKKQNVIWKNAELMENVSENR